MKLTASSFEKIKLSTIMQTHQEKKKAQMRGKSGEVTTNSTVAKRMITMNSGC